MNGSPDYVYMVDDIAPNYRVIQCKKDYKGGAPYAFHLAFDCSRIMASGDEELCTVAYDFIELGAILPAIDWLSKRRRDDQCRISVSIPVYNPSLFQIPENYEELRSILFWFTEDNWDIQFVARTQSTQFGDYRHLAMHRRQSVALWSGGLDACLGAINTLKNERDIDSILLVGTGFDNYMCGKQRALYELFRDEFGERVELAQIALGLGGVPATKNSLSRLRAFGFLMHGAAAAILEGYHSLRVYENGPGALNLHFSSAEIGLDHPRSVHPHSLRIIERFICRCTGQPFTIFNPFFLATKGEKCSELTVDSNLVNLLLQTNSCDKKPHTRTRQCGICTSCLQRRQSLNVAGIVELGGYAYNEIPLGQDGKANALFAMLNQIDQLEHLLSANNPWHALSSVHPLLLDVIEDHKEIADIQVGLLDLLVRYIGEWRLVEHNIIQGFLVGRENVERYIEYRRETRDER